MEWGWTTENQLLPYVEHMKAMNRDIILFILDTGLNHRDCEFFGIDVQNIDPTLTIKFVPAIPNDNTAVDLPLPVELQITRDDSGQLMESIASKAMNR